MVFRVAGPMPTWLIIHRSRPVRVGKVLSVASPYCGFLQEIALLLSPLLYRWC